MPAPKGHKRWGNPCNPKIYKTPEDLWAAAVDYFKWCEANPWIKNDFIRGGESAGQIVELKTSRPYTIERFCIHAGITIQTFINYSSRKGYETFFEISSHIRQIIRTQKFEGAAVGVFNHAIIARDLGLVDKKDLSSSDGSMSPKELTIINKSDKKLDISHLTKNQKSDEKD